MSNDTKTTTFNFPFEKLTPIVGEPTNATITILKRQIYANAMENTCTLGCGTLGYLGLIMPTTDFSNKQLAISPGEPVQPFTKPTPTEPLDDDTVAEDEYKEDKRKLRDYNAMESRLKQQLLAAIDNTYITSLEDAEVGFAMVTSKQILQHVMTEYGAITLDELAENIEKLNEPWNSDLPIRLLWDRIRECQRIGTAGGEPISDRMVMFTALKLLDGTGLFSTHTHGWRQTYPLQAAWNIDTFKEFFNYADKERKKTMTTKDAGFHGANAVTKATPTSTTTSTPSTNATTTRNDNNFVDPSSGRKIYYCWSHGGSLNPDHTSAKCLYPKEGHQKEATWMNMMDGCCEMKLSKNKFKKGKKATAAAATTTTTSE
jgi:hypothetical protein